MDDKSSEVEKSIREFYDKFGWVETNGLSGEDKVHREISTPYHSYHVGVDARTANCFSNLSGKLLMAGGGDIPESHIKIAQKFAATTCLDISDKANEIARRKLNSEGEFITGSILSLPKPDNYFDAAFCAHVIYHIDKDSQEKAVREMIRVTRPGGKIVIIYRNPDSLPARLREKKARPPSSGALNEIRRVNFKFQKCRHYIFSHIS